MYSFGDLEPTKLGDTIVKCCNRDRCEAIYEYMEGQKKC